MEWFYTEFAQGLSCYTLLWYFLIYSVLGWVAEVAYCTLGTGKMVNRGMLCGPVCPIYGFGMVLMLCVLTPLGLLDSVLGTFLGAGILASLVELLGGWALEKIFHTRWWDYSERPFNLGGYICLQYAVMWGLGGLLLLQLIHPGIAWLISRLPHSIGLVLLLLLLAVLLEDFIVTVLTLLRLGNTLKDLEKASALLRLGSDAVSEQMGETLLALREKYDLVGKKEQMKKREEERAKLRAQRAELDLRERAEWDRQHLAELREKLLLRAEKHSRRLAEAFPDSRHISQDELWEEIKERHRQRRETRLLAKKERSLAKKQKEQKQHDRKED